MSLPGDLFAQLWLTVVPHQGRVVTRPWAGRSATEFDAIARALHECETADVPLEIEAYLSGDDGPFDCSVKKTVERAFVVMCALDHVAETIHPAMKTRLGGRTVRGGAMLSAWRARRFEEGVYGSIGDAGFVVPKGHLMTRDRPADDRDASGSDLAHQFAYLSFISPPSAGRTVRMLALPPSKFSVPDGRASLVGLAPIAEDRDDLTFVASQRGTRAYLDTEAHEPDQLAQRISATVTALLDDGAGLIVLPELVATAGSVAQLQDALRDRLGSRSETPALILAGSGPGKDVCPDSGRPFNEVALLSADGRVLARQRKIHLFNMGADRMEQCGIAPAQGFEGRNHMEDAAGGAEVVICDLLGLGRVMVLICEDLEQQDPGGELAVQLRPDWIITPVLDVSQAIGRWTHTRAVELGRRTQSRLVISCSGTLCVRYAKADRLVDLGGEDANTGLCFDGFSGLTSRLVSTAGFPSPARVLVPWESAAWRTRRVIAGDPPKRSSP